MGNTHAQIICFRRSTYKFIQQLFRVLMCQALGAKDSVSEEIASAIKRQEGKASNIDT